MPTLTQQSQNKPQQKTVRIVLVDDSAAFRQIAYRLVSRIPGIEIVGDAADGLEALDLVKTLDPDLLLLDNEMPNCDGLEVLRRLRAMASRTRAIMISGVGSEETAVALEALRLGAFDFIPKICPVTLRATPEHLCQELGTKIDAYRVSIGAPSDAASASLAKLAETMQSFSSASIANDMARTQSKSAIRAVAVGASTGGPAALEKLLPKLSTNLGVPIFIAQHMPPLFTSSLATSLNELCRLPVLEGEDGTPVKPCHVYIAPGGRHMKVVRQGGTIQIKLSDDPPENHCRPAVDYLFRSVSALYGGAAAGVILTGMGEDGWAGSRVLKQQGATIVAQSQESCAVFGMPRGPIEEGIADFVEPLSTIAARIGQLCRRS